MPRKRIWCEWPGCSASSYSQSQMDVHQAKPHRPCVCGRYMTPHGMRSHQKRCEIFQAMAEDGVLRCAGCDREIVEGMHYMLMRELVTLSRMPIEYTPVIPVPNTTLKNIVLCGLECFEPYARKTEEIADVFGAERNLPRTYAGRRYEMVIDGEKRWHTLTNAGHAYDSGFFRVEFGTQVIEPDGTFRPMTDDDKRAIDDMADRISENK